MIYYIWFEVLRVYSFCFVSQSDWNPLPLPSCSSACWRQGFVVEFRLALTFVVHLPQPRNCRHHSHVPRWLDSFPFISLSRLVSKAVCVHRTGEWKVKLCRILTGVSPEQPLHLYCDLSECAMLVTGMTPASVPHHLCCALASSVKVVCRFMSFTVSRHPII